MRNDSKTDVVAVQSMKDALQELQQKLQDQERSYGPMSGEVGLALMAMVAFLEKKPGNEETIKRLNERVEEIYQLYLDACEE